MRTQILSWWQQTPLPTTTATPSFQKWHKFDQERWTPLASDKRSQSSIRHQWAGSFRLVSWNVNADAPFPKPRISALLQVLKTTTGGAIDIIFLQEVSREALISLLEEPWIQQNWYTSDISASAFRHAHQKFISITLVSKLWLVGTNGIQLGAVWRIPLPSRFGRDALCCDVLVNSSSSSKHTSVIPNNNSNNDNARCLIRIRLVNVHLDSLPINPSLRPRQLAICAELLRAAGRGIVAGDFNPVLPDDEELVRASGLVDAWALVHPGDPGHTCP
jgi:tyrosyl-DNA phosphodiesterase 2